MCDIITLESPDLELATLVTAAGFVQPPTPELRLDVERHFAQGRLVYSVHRNGRLGGYALFRVMDQVLYLGGVMLLPELQGCGIAIKFIERAHADSGVHFLGLRTQSPRMWTAGLRATTSWIPRENAADEELAHLGRGLAAALGCSFPVHPGFYGGSLYGQKPVHGDPRLQAWWDSICNTERGDAVICVGRLR